MHVVGMIVKLRCHVFLTSVCRDLRELNGSVQQHLLLSAMMVVPDKQEEEKSYSQ